MTRTLALLAASCAAVFATVTPAAAGPAAISAADDPCPTGNVCVYPIQGQPVLVPHGGSATFPAGTRATVANRTTITYCVAGQVLFSVPAGGTVDEIRLVTAVAPQPPGGACLH